MKMKRYIEQNEGFGFLTFVSGNRDRVKTRIWVDEALIQYEDPEKEKGYTEPIWKRRYETMTELPKETKLYRISAGLAQKKRLPIYFIGRPVIQTQKAVYLHGRGTTETVRIGRCMCCGRTLTHPVSVALGIGPECGQHSHNRDLIGGYTEENIERLKKEIIKITVNSWVPKSCIKEILDTQETVHIPQNHPMLRPTKTKQTRAATLVRYQDGKPAIKITFPFNHDDLKHIKSLAGRRFHNEGREKYWTCPLSLETVESLRAWGFELDEQLQEFLTKSKVHVDKIEQIEVPNLKKELFDFQKKGVAFIEAKNGRALIGDSMGLGKTAQALAWLQLHPEKRPAIVIVPASLKLNWKKEAEMWMQEPKVQILSGTKPDIPITGEIIIINYDIVKDWVEALRNIHAQVLILDEAHFVKSNRAQRTKAVKKLGKNIPHIIGLSGTPIVNRPIEMYNALKLINDTVVPSFWQYAQRYCGARHNGFGWDFSGATNTEELHERLTNTIMIRRKKEDVLKDLPPKIRSIVPIELSNRQEYSRAEADFITWVKERKGLDAAKKASNAEAFVKIEGLKQLSIKGKIKHAIDWISDHLSVNGKLVVFASHRSTIDQVMEVFKDQAVKIDGSVTKQDRQKAVDSFQSDPKVRLFVGNIKAAGVGITLTVASSVVFLELGWSPGEHDQAEDRIYRIGQDAQSINIYYLIAKDTIEKEIITLLDKKRKVLDQVLDGKNTESESLLSELLRTYSE